VVRGIAGVHLPRLLRHRDRSQPARESVDRQARVSVNAIEALVV